MIDSDNCWAGDWYTIYQNLSSITYCIQEVWETNPSKKINQPLGIWDIYGGNNISM